MNERKIGTSISNTVQPFSTEPPRLASNVAVLFVVQTEGQKKRLTIVA